MALSDDIREFFELPSWRTRVGNVITMTSPDGNVYSAKFRKSTRSQEKKLGLHDYPKINGTIVQDMGAKSRTYSWVANFDGVDNDLEADKFFSSLEETGLWVVIHPIHGQLELQPVRFEPDDDPTDSGNITAVATEWIKPAENFVIKTESELASEIEAQQDATNAASAVQAVSNTAQTAASQVAAIRSAVQQALSTFNTIMTTINDVINEFNAIYSAITDIIAQTTMEIESLIGQIQQIMELPALVSQDLTTRFSAVSSIINGVMESVPTGSSPETKNSVAMQEVFLTSGLTSLALIVSTSKYETRSQAIEAMTNLQELFESVTNYLDDIQSNFTGEDLDNQFFSQSSAYNDLYQIMSLSMSFLMTKSFNLKSEKKVILKNKDTTWNVAVREYSKTGNMTADNTDDYYDKFIATNKLKGDEIYLLPAGKEYVVYV